jgi:serine/threonine protein kinase
LLGIGSFATVWLGYDAASGARVAIKVLAENWSHDLGSVNGSWRRPGCSGGWITSGSSGSTRWVSFRTAADLVMRGADRGSLRDRLAHAPLSVEPECESAVEIGAGVAVLHENGIVHRT